jgi:hypothetical protein
MRFSMVKKVGLMSPCMYIGDVACMDEIHHG